uniref:Uncharacterized protein n=1 Tax=Virgibacillus oceani TaxID=1479511 RepID=A0A917M0W5_9BACI|nr:hypothetical protein GCM10011398_12820 [Virgibacillus oceani]
MNCTNNFCEMNVTVYEININNDLYESKQGTRIRAKKVQIFSYFGKARKENTKTDVKKGRGELF